MPLEPMRVAVYAGVFDSQPLVFAHLLDVAPRLDLDHVDVICGIDPGPRLAHALEPQDAQTVEDVLGLRTTVVLIFAAALPQGARLPERTGRLSRVASFTGRRLRPTL